MIKRRDMVILALVAIVFVSLSLSLRSKSDSVSEYQIRTLLGDVHLAMDNIQRIVLRRNGLQLEFEKSEGVWWQREPFSVRMDPYSMRTLIESVQGVEVKADLADTQSVELLGLGDDANMIELFDGELRVSIRMGRRTLGGLAYASIDDGVPVLVDQSLHRRAIDMDYRLWRDIRIFPDFAIDGTRIEREGDSGRLLLERIDGRWEMREPASTRVDQGLLTEWVGQLAGARVGSFVVDQPSDLSLFGLQTPIAFFAVGNRQGTTHKLLIGGRVSAGSNDRYVMLEGHPVVFSLRWNVVSQFFPVPELLVDGTGSGVSRFDAKRITIRSQDYEITIQRELERWIDISRSGIVVDNNAVEALLHWILDTKPTSIGFGSYPREREVGTITFEGYDLIPLDTVRIARNEDGNWILENGDNVLRIHPPEAGDVLSPFMKD